MTRTLRASSVALGVMSAIGALVLLMSGIALSASAERGTLVDASGVGVTGSAIADEVAARVTLGVAGLILAATVFLMLVFRHRAMAIPAALAWVGVVLVLILSGMGWAWQDGTLLILIVMVAALFVLALMVWGRLHPLQPTR